jgi:hypothetical protein
VHVLHERPFGLALDRGVAVIVPFEPPGVSLPAIESDGETPLVDPHVLFALAGVACLVILLAGLHDALITSAGQLGIPLERARGILLFGGVEILFAVAVVILIAGSG